MGSLSLTHWIIVLVIVLLVFGTKKLKNIGTDLGSAVKGFKEGMASGDDKKQLDTAGHGQTIDADVKDKTHG